MSYDIFHSKEQGTNCNFITFTAEYHQRIIRLKDDNIFRITSSASISKHVIGKSSQGQNLRVFLQNNGAVSALKSQMLVQINEDPHKIYTMGNMHGCKIFAKIIFGVSGAIHNDKKDVQMN